MTKPLASAYVRLSTAAKSSNLSLTGMQDEVVRLIRSLGFDVYAVHVDEALSGAIRDRPEFVAWLDDARAGRVSMLAAFHGDRITREGVNAAALVLDVLEGKDPTTGKVVRQPVRFVSCDGLDSERDAESFRWRFVIAAEVARAERERIRARNLATRARLRSQGRIPGGRRPWPFKAAPREGGGVRWVPNTDRAALIRGALEALRGGGSLAAVARTLGRSVSSTRRLLASPTLYGAQVQNGDVVRDDDYTVRLDPGQAILTFGEWRELQTLVAARSTERSPADASPALLAGLLHCATCGRVMYPHRPAGRTWTYRCRGGDCLQPVSVAMQDADAHVEAAFHATMGDHVPPARTVTEYGVDADEVARLQDALGAIDRLLAGDVGDEEALGYLRARRDLRERLSAAQGTAPEVTRERDTRTYAEQYAAAGETSEQTALLDLAFDRITVLPGQRYGGGKGFDPERIQFGCDPRDYA